MKRKVGFYWVKKRSQWIVAFYALGNVWELPGEPMIKEYVDSDFEEIKEEILQEPN